MYKAELEGTLSKDMKELLEKNSIVPGKALTIPLDKSGNLRYSPVFNRRLYLARELSWPRPKALFSLPDAGEIAEQAHHDGQTFVEQKTVLNPRSKHENETYKIQI